MSAIPTIPGIGTVPAPVPMTAPTAGTTSTTGGTKQAAPAVVVTAPLEGRALESWERMRRGVDTARSATGRVVTVAGAAAGITIAAVPTGPVVAVTIGAAAVTVAAGTAVLRLSAPHAGHQKAAATFLYAWPGVGFAVVTAAQWIAAVTSVAGPATKPLQVVLPLVWAAGVWLLRPARAARRMVTPPPAKPSQGRAAVAVPEAGQHPAALWWSTHVAVPGGAAPGTVLEDIRPSGTDGVTATIRATTPGKPVPQIPIPHLSALLDVPEDRIQIVPVPGRGAGVRRLIVGSDETETDADFAAHWAREIAPRAMPGSTIVDIRVGPAPALPTDHS